jgi:single-strand DNA-binding protein
MLNKAMLIGNLGDDPSIHQTTSGETVANISLATNQRWKDSDDQVHEHTEWHRVVCFGKIADFVALYLGTGRLVYVEGRLRTRRWQKGSTDMYTTEIVASKVQALGPRPVEEQEEQGKEETKAETGAKTKTKAKTQDKATGTKAA